MRRWPVAALVLHAACKFPYPADVPDDDVTGSDAAHTCVPSTTTCDDARGEYIVCSAAGEVETSLHCPLGCAPDEEKCLDIDPHNGLAMYLDMVPDPPDLVLNGPTIIDPDSGAILDAGVGITVPTFDSQGIRIYVVRSLDIKGTTTFPPYRTHSLAIVASGDIQIRGLVDASAHGGVSGPGGRFPLNQNEDLECQGGERFASPPTPSAGAGGAGGVHSGGAGGTVQASLGGPGGLMRSSLEPLLGGCAGGSVYFTTMNSSTGGAGGGSLQLVSRTSIVIREGGQINASGGGATAGASQIGGGGGGAGGTILLEAPQVVLDGPAVVLSTKGGGGAGASGAAMAGAGADGGTGPAAATGGTSPVQSPGGTGGTSTQPPSGGADAAGGGISGAGGGGAAGMTAVFTTAGAIAPQNGAAIHGGLTTARLRTRLVP